MALFKTSVVLLVIGCIVTIARQRPTAARRLLALSCSAVAVVVLSRSGLLVVNAAVLAE